jgi:hypothetical protein
VWASVASIRLSGLPRRFGINIYSLCVPHCISCVNLHTTLQVVSWNWDGHIPLCIVIGLLVLKDVNILDSDLVCLRGEAMYAF